MYQPLRGARASAARIIKGGVRNYAFRIVRIPKPSPEANRYRRIHPDLVALEDLKNVNRNQLMGIYEALGEQEVKNRVDNDYLDAVMSQTVALNLSLLPEDYSLVFKRLRQLPTLLPGCTTELNEGVRRLSCNFNHKQIAVIIRSYAALSSRSITTITELIKRFNKNIDEAEVWQLREVASALATLRIRPKEGTVVETLYKNALAIIPRHLKTMHADDIGVFLNSFARQNVNHDEILHFIDIHAKRIIHEASTRNVALITNAFARADRHSPQLMKAVKNRMETELHNFLKRQSETEPLARVNNGTVEDISGSSRVLKLVESPKDDEVQPGDTSSADMLNDSASRSMVSTGADLNIIDVAMIFNALTKLEDSFDKLLNAYISWLNHHINTDTPTLSLVLVAHAYSHAGIRNIDLFNRIAHVIIRRINTLNCQQLGVISLSFAKVGHNIPILFLRIADEIIYRGTVALKFKRYHFDFQSLEHLMQAFSRIGFKDQRLYSVLTVLLKHRLRTPDGDELNGEMIASMLASMSRNQVEGFVPLVTDAIVRSKDSTAYSTPALCKVLSSFSRLNVKHSKILEFMLKETKDRVNEFQIPLLVNTLKALAKLKCYNLTLIKESLKRCSLHLAHLSNHDIANLLSALNDYNFRNVSFLQKLIMCIKHRMGEFTSNQLHMIFTRLAMLRTSDAGLYNELIEKIIHKQHEFNEVQLADICTGYLYVLVHFDYLQRAITMHQHSQRLHDQDHGEQDSMRLSESGVSFPVDEENVVNTNRTLSQPPNCPTSNLSSYGFNDSIFDAMLSHLGTKLDVATIFKVQTVHLYLEHVRTDIYSRLSKKAKDVLHKCSCVKFSLAEYMLTSSSVHRELSHFLNLMGIIHRNEVQFGPYLIDIVPETSSNKRVAIEYDGPTHFYAETTMRTAKSILKHEILENTGWKVLHVPYQEWAQLVSSKQKIIYLNNIRNKYEGGGSSPITATLQTGIQKRNYSSALDRKRRYLQKINEEILKEAMEMSEDDATDEIRESGDPSSTEKIVEEVCNKLMEGNRSIRDIDCEKTEKEGSPDVGINKK